MATRNYYTTVYQGSTGPAANAFVATWNTANTSTGSSASNQIKLPLVSGGTYNFTVEWGDGNSDVITVWNQSEVTHTYASSGVKTIICTPNVVGGLTGWQFNNTGDRLKILTVTQWGDWRPIDVATGWFFGCTNFNITATDSPNLSGILSMLNAFRLCSSLTSGLSNWNVSGIISFATAFFGATNFNQNIGSWNVSSGTSFSSMFGFATSFNQNIGSWNVSSGALFTSMFQSATSFNQNISSWNLSNATNLNLMFQSANAFQANLAAWDVNQVQSFADFMLNKTGANKLTTANYDALLIGWAAQLPFNASARSINFGGAQYTLANPTVVAARAALVAHFTTLFQDGGGI